MVRVRSITASHSAKQLGLPCLCEEGSLDPVVCAVNSVHSSLCCLQHRGLFPASDEVYLGALSSCHDRLTDLFLDTPVRSCFYRGVKRQQAVSACPSGTYNWSIRPWCQASVYFRQLLSSKTALLLALMISLTCLR